ncbi:MAG: 50S ribosome-binding GTPase, partial [Coriobacteriales bacterium]|nr:50S ribosome-binding GTPase [Coriobacteriales bacterium]
MQIALIGNPNSGKTVLFNELTGANQHVGNWPGVTVEQKRGQIREQYGSGELVDLPGIYSLSPFSMEEIVSRDFLLNDQPDVVINIIDATNLERNLYLSIQLIELNAPMVMALNMMDEVEREGFRIDTQRLSDDLGVPVVGISATQRWGLQELMAALENAQPSKRHELPNKQLERLIKRVEVLLARHLEYEHNLGDAEARGYPLHWVAIKVLEGDELVFSHLTLDDSTMQAIDNLKAEFEQQYGPLGSAFADARYQLIHEMIYRDVTVWAWDGSHHHHLKHAPEGYLQLSHEENEI